MKLKRMQLMKLNIMHGMSWDFTLCLWNRSTNLGLRNLQRSRKLVFQLLLTRGRLVFFLLLHGWKMDHTFAGHWILLMWQDVVGAAETGSGKTLAFGLPILQRLLDEREKSGKKSEEEGADAGRYAPRSLLRALIITPTRELAIQVVVIFYLILTHGWTLK